jgi:hypothetical protein
MAQEFCTGLLVTNFSLHKSQLSRKLKLCAKVHFTLCSSRLQSKPTHTHLQHVIRLPVTAQAIVRPMTENHENQTPYVLIRGKTLPFLYN